MSEFLENLKVRHAEAQKRFLAKQQEVNRVNAEFQAVAQEFNAWQTLLNLETRKEQVAAVATTVAANSPAPTVPPTLAVNSTPAPAGVVVTSVGVRNEENKTEIVRDLLRQASPGSMSAADIWEAIRNRVSNRAYLYSVLSRMKDKGEVGVKRGRYFFKFSLKPEETKEHLTQ